MKPLFLEIEGLHSFREKQTVDFAALSGYGVFGIFGPTGSGKSTILDALTLALYGTVVRAKRDTQGILNQAEHRLRVSLLFTLGAGEAQRRYRVERTYTRGADFGVKAGASRLVEVLPTAERVLEDQPRRITSRIEAILGLTAEDFTRAVVLPQGRFAEFLTLDGKDRRLMLERLFTLETYGQRLTAVLLHRRQETAQRLIAIVGEQAGLGDASPAALEAAGLAQQAAREALSVAHRHLQAAQTRHQRQARIGELQAELHRVQGSLATLEQQEDAVIWREERIATARAAEGLRPSLEALAVAREVANQAQVQRQQAEAERARLAQAGAEAWQARRERESRREAEEPLLHLRQGRLRQALDLQQEIDRLLPPLGELEEAIRQLEERERETLAKLGRLQEAQKAATDEVLGVREGLLACAIPPGQRSRIHEAFTAWRALEEARETAATAAAEADSKEQAATVTRMRLAEAVALQETAAAELAARREALRRWQELRPATEEEVRRRQGALEESRLRLRDLSRLAAESMRLQEEVREQEQRLQCMLRREQEAGRLLEATREALEGSRREEALAEARLAEANIRQLASSLASHLVAGTPCPVCGSPAHPLPAWGEEEERTACHRHLEAAREARAAAEQRLEEARKAGVVLSGARQGEETLLQDRREALSRLQQGEETLRTSWSREVRDLSLEEFSRRVAQEEEALLLLAEEGHRWQEAGGSLDREVAEAQERAMGAQGALARAEAALQAAEAALAEARQRDQRAAEQCAGKESLLEQVRGGLPAGEIEARYREMAERDRRAQQLEEQLGTLDTRIGEIRRQIEGWERERTETARELAVQGERRQGILRALTGKRAERDTLAEGRPPAEGLRATEEQLGTLRRLFQEADAAWNEVREALGRAEQTLAASEGQQKEAERRLVAAVERLAADLSAAGFATATEAEGALLPPGERQTWEAEIAGYRQEQTRLRLEVQRLATLLGDDRLTPVEWEETEAHLASAQTDYREAAAAEGVALRALEEMREKAIRWQELERQRLALEGEGQRLGHLQELLKGNALVEFLAREQLEQVARDASHRLGRLTRGRFALEVSGQDGFLMRDHGGGGHLRPVHTLSGGETFLVSLALSISLSSQIQLRGEYPLEFFFLDEGFGTLDPGLLDTVMRALEQLHLERMNIGVISHVPEIRSRLQRRLIVEAAEPGGRGTRLRLERA